MPQQIIGLCDSNLFYAGRLIHYFEEQKSFPYHVMMFTEVAQLKSYCAAGTLRYLIISEDLLSADGLLEELSVCGLHRLFVLQKQNAAKSEAYKHDRTYAHNESEPELSEGVVCEREETVPPERISLYRYQPAGMLMRQIMAELGEEIPCGSRKLCIADKTIFIGIYTPVGRCMQTTFSLLLGQLLTKKARTLYLNMEGYSGLRILLGRDLKPDISDLIYYAGRNHEQFMKRMEGMIDTIGGLEYIPPASTFMDLGVIEAGQWIRLLEELRERDRFTYVILDLTEQMQGLFEILRRCDRIYTIETKDAIGIAKIAEYEKILTMTDYVDILKKTKKKQLPGIRNMDIDFEQLIYSELADYVKKLVAEEF